MRAPKTDDELEQFAREVSRVCVASRSAGKEPSTMELALEVVVRRLDELRDEKERRMVFFRELAKEGIIT